MKTDRDGQPLVRAFNWDQNVDKAIESLLGICQGVVADGELNSAEILFLNAWLKENDEIADCWPGDVIASRVKQILADGTVSAEEAEDLKQTLTAVIGGGFLDIGAAGGLATRLPVDEVDAVSFAGASFCLTGKFLYGPRKRCEEAVVTRGGLISVNVTQKLNYLVIGTLCSRDWLWSSHGRKIEKAVGYKRQGHPLLILSEEIWADSL